MNLQEITKLVETSIAGLKLDAVASRGAKEGQWSIKVKDATVWIDAFDFPTSPGKFYLQVMSPLCAVPDKKKDEFAWDLLEINYKLCGSWMCKKENWIYVLSLREASGLDQSEVDATLDRVSFYSSDYYSKLNFKYEGCWLPKAPNAD
ncbi:MAG TPA: YbjN domain-containing protein, partial [Bacteroidia bacterium]